MLEISTEADVLKLIGQAESARLEFKSGRLFGDRQHAIAKLSREVSAFANSEGGTLIVGLEERRDGPNRIAHRIEGFDREAAPQHWLQQAVESSVSPYLPGIRFRYIALSSEQAGRYCVAITVPGGTTAYQAKDKLYYGRSEFEVVALPDHEIRLRLQRGRSAQLGLVIADEDFIWMAGDPDEDSLFDAAQPFEQQRLKEWFGRRCAGHLRASPMFLAISIGSEEHWRTDGSPIHAAA